MIDRPHIMHVLLSLDAGGMEGGVVNLINEMDIRPFKISVCCLERSGILEEKILPDKRKVFVLGKKPGLAYSLPFRLARLFKKEKVDIVHTHNFTTYLYAGLGAIMAGVPFIIQGEHGDLPLQKDKALFIRWRRYLARFTDAFFTVSQRLKENLIEWAGIDPGKIFSIPNGVDVNIFRAAAPSFDKRRIGFKEGDFVIGAVGRLDAVKNYSLLISVFPEVLKSVKNCRLIFVGDGKERENLLGMVERLGLEGRVRFLGFSKEITPFYRLMDILIQPSLSEGMSNTVLEAMSCGKPVVASSVGGNPELVVDGVTGHLFPSERGDILVQKITSIVNDREKRRRMGEVAAKMVEERFFLKRMVRDYETLYRRICFPFGLD